MNKLYLLPGLALLVLVGSCSHAGIEQHKQVDIESSSSITLGDTIGGSAQQYSVVSDPLVSDFVQAFVEDYLRRPIEDVGYREDVMRWLEEKNTTTLRFRLVLDSVLKKADEEEPELGLGYDPLIEGQDNASAYTVDRYDAATNSYLLRGVPPEDGYTARIRVVKQDGRLLVDGFGEINME